MKRRSIVLPKAHSSLSARSAEGLAVQHLIRLRWPDGMNCPGCGVAVASSRERLRCTRCGRDLALWAGTDAEGSKLPASAWLRAATAFAAARRGLSVRALKREAGVSVETAHRLITLFRAALLRWRPLERSPATVLLAELEVGPRLFRLNPEPKSSPHLRVLIAAGIELGPTGRLKKLASLRALRLIDGNEATLAEAIKTAAVGARSIFVFQGGRIAGTATLGLQSFLSDTERAGGEFARRLDDLRTLLVSIPHRRLDADGVDAVLAEFAFRHYFRSQHTLFIADRLLELVLAPKMSRTRC